MSRFQTIVFDLDGTLTASAPGIVNAVRYALAKQGMEEKSMDRLLTFVGPPLFVSLKKYYQMSDEACWQAVKDFREYYNADGWKENSVYPGIPELLRDLKAAGKTLILASSKPTFMAKQVLDHFDLSRYFDRIQGADEDGDGSCQKAAIIRKAVVDCPKPILMVGDRENDCQGGQENGILVAGVLYGYGSSAELQLAGARYIVETVEQLRNVLLDQE